MLATTLLSVLLATAPRAESKGYLLSDKQSLLLPICIGVADPFVSGNDVLATGARKTQMELALRRNGLPICGPGEKKGIPGILLLIVTVLRNSGGGYAAHWELKVSQALRIEYQPKGPPVRVFGITWERGGILSGGSAASLDEHLEKALAPALDGLCNDYLSALQEAAQGSAAESQ